jgi:uncharacterized protein (DUF2062 family)
MLLKPARNTTNPMVGLPVRAFGEDERAGLYLKDRWRKKLTPVLDLFTQGLSPEKVALCIAVGVMMGIFPIFGVTSILGLAAALVLRLNLPAMQLINYLVYPLQLVLVIPFIRMGEWIFGSSTMHITLDRLMVLARSDFWEALTILETAILQAVAAWLVVGSALVPCLYLVVKLLLRRTKWFHPALPESAAADSV